MCPCFVKQIFLGVLAPVPGTGSQQIAAKEVFMDVVGHYSRNDHDRETNTSTKGQSGKERTSAEPYRKETRTTQQGKR